MVHLKLCKALQAKKGNDFQTKQTINMTSQVDISPERPSLIHPSRAQSNCDLQGHERLLRSDSTTASPGQVT